VHTWEPMEPMEPMLTILYALRVQTLLGASVSPARARKAWLWRHIAPGSPPPLPPPPPTSNQTLVILAGLQRCTSNRLLGNHQLAHLLKQPGQHTRTRHAQSLQTLPWSFMLNPEIALAIVYIWLRLRLPEVVQRTLIPSYGATKSGLHTYNEKKVDGQKQLPSQRVARVTK
jgi:hypothetical protein